MAEALIGGAIVSALTDLLIKKLASPEVISFFKRRNLDNGLLNKLKATMKSVNKVLNDAEEKQITNVEVKAWLDDLQDTVYETDDFLDAIAYEAQRLKLKAGPQTPTRIKSFLTSLIPSKKGAGKLQLELEKILQNLEILVQQKDALGLIEHIGGTTPSDRMPTTFLIDESVVYGREADKEAIRKLLLSDSVDTKGCRQLDVIPIVGLPGVGKTTLARLVYNDSKVVKWFDFRAWVYVSEEFNVMKVTKEILKNLTTESCDTMTMNQLHTELQERLKEKKVLLVLDDVWVENQSHWDLLLRPFISVTQGSKMIVTTRHEHVASVRSTIPFHCLQQLSEGDCFLVFERHAFDGVNSEDHPGLKRIGEEIVRKCKGVPLAARALGSLLRLNRDVEDWEGILKSNIWDSPNDSILPALRLSYHYLPSHLKQCFAYCGMFPKGWQFDKKRVVLLWMAEGFLGNKEMEEVGDKYFNDLASRSFFQASHVNPSCFVMHDLFNDLAKYVSAEFFYSMEDDHSCQPSKRTRQLFSSGINFNACIFEAPYLRSLIVSSKKEEEDLEEKEGTNEADDEPSAPEGSWLDTVLLRLKHLRVLLLESYEGLVELPDSIGNLKHLRLLDLASTSITRLPETVSNLHNLQTLALDNCTCLIELHDSIGNLKQLQYLSLQKTSIKRLPESTSGLSNLQTLNLNGCEYLVELPTNMMGLSNLCYLDIQDTSLQFMPSEMGKLTKLKQLTDFFLGKQNGSSIKELGELQHLQGGLRIWNIQNIENVGDVLAAKMKDKKQLTMLELTWDDDSGVSLHHDILEELHPHKSVETLSIVGYGDARLPNWMVNPSFSKIVTLHLKKCKYFSSLPPLGQLSSLKELSVIEFDGVLAIGPEFYGSPASGMKPFASLEVLRLERMAQLQQWQIEGGAFSVLRELYLILCPNLTLPIPVHLHTLNTLVIDGCGQFPSLLPRCSVINMMKIRHDSLFMELKKLSSGLYYLKVEGFDSLDEMLKAGEQVSYFASDIGELEIKNFNSLEYFPMNLFPRVNSLHFDSCPKLRTFSLEGNLDNFTSLNSLSISCCPIFYFPTSGLPAPVLTQLSIRDCKKLISSPLQWGLQQLPSLSKFRIACCHNVESFPEGNLLPSTLSSLRISSLTNLKSLDYDGIKHLTSLIELAIEDCPVLQSLPEEGLPSSLSSLVITRCPLLEKRCFTDWNKISHISNILLC